MKQNVAVIVAHGDRMIERDKVVKAYSGKPGCCCGCRGKYYRSGASASQDAQVTKIVSLLNANIKDVKFTLDGGGDPKFAFLETDNRWYIAYFN